VFYNTGTGHQGTIEVLVDKDRLPLPSSRFEPMSSAPKRSFARIIIHELGHYFGLRHLVPSENTSKDDVLISLLNSSSMAMAYSQTSNCRLP
jgi:hypothetical protein